MTHVASSPVGFRRRSLSTRLLTGFAFLSLLTGMAGGAGILFVREIKSSVEVVTGTASPLLGNVMHLVDDVHMAEAAVTEGLGADDGDDLRAAISKLEVLRSRYHKSRCPRQRPACASASRESREMDR